MSSGIPAIRSLMGQVLLALLPAIALHVVLIGPRVLLQWLLAAAAALAFEALALSLRRRPVREALGDGSALVAATLLTLSVTPLLPHWQLLLGIGFAILIGKHAFGGLGHNPFNPAMLGYAVLLVSFPLSMTRWPASAMNVDGTTAATPLDRLYDSARFADGTPALHEPVLTGDWLFINATIVLGGLYLLWRGIIRWHIPGGMLAALIICYLLSDLLGHPASLPLHLELLSGGVALGAFFIATDPVSAAAGARGRLLYGSGIGVLCFVIREWSAYPEGVAFAVLLMNLCVPAIDRYLPEATLTTGKDPAP